MSARREAREAILEVRLKRWIIAVTAVAAMSLSGCQKSADSVRGGSSHHGRYLGVGVYPAGQMWSQMATANSPKDTAVAKLADDEQVIVVVDSKTGELRQCGNLTGYCVSMNPWANPPTQSQTTPLRLLKHAGELQPEAAAVAAKP